MNKEQLREEYEAGRLDRPARLRYFADDLEEHTGKRPPQALGETREWWANNKAVVARKLKDEESEDDDEETSSDEQTSDNEEINDD